MLTLYAGGVAHPLNIDDYYIRELASGLDEVVFNISIYDPVYPLIEEEASLRDRDLQSYLIKQIDAGGETAKVVAQIDLDDLRAVVISHSGSRTIRQALDTVVSNTPGWSYVDNSQSNQTVPLELVGVTPLDYLLSVAEGLSLAVRFDTVTKKITAVNPKLFEPVGAFVTTDLNLRQLNYKGKSNGFATRLYAEGADGLTFQSINDGKGYVDNNTYSSRVVAAYWKDDRYTDAQSLLDAATKKLAEMAIPARSYDCDVVDLRATNPGLYNFQDFSLFSVVKLVDKRKETAINHQVVERWTFPHYPEKNKVILSTSPPKIQNQITQLTQSITNPNSLFQQQQAAAVANATNWITGANGGYVVFRKDESGQPYEILIMDTDSIETATKVWRWNNGGLGYSSNGYNGPYSTAITQDGAIVADFITAGELNANVIKTGILQGINGGSSINLDTGEVNLEGTFTTTEDGEGQSVVIDKSRIYFKLGDEVVAYAGPRNDAIHLDVPIMFGEYVIYRSGGNDIGVKGRLNKDGLKFEDDTYGQWSYTPGGIDVDGDNFSPIYIQTNNGETVRVLGHY